VGRGGPGGSWGYGGNDWNGGGRGPGGDWNGGGRRPELGTATTTPAPTSNTAVTTVADMSAVAPPARTDCCTSATNSRDVRLGAKVASRRAFPFDALPSTLHHNNIHSASSAPLACHGVHAGRALRGLNQRRVAMVAAEPCADFVFSPRTSGGLLVQRRRRAEPPGHVRRWLHVEGDGQCDSSDRRWPHFASAAIALGVRSVMSFRMYTHGADSGALNLFGFDPGPFAVDPEALGAMLATHAASMQSGRSNNSRVRLRTATPRYTPFAALHDAHVAA
jgi:hypothetical protein